MGIHKRCISIIQFAVPSLQKKKVTYYEVTEKFPQYQPVWFLYMDHLAPIFGNNWRLANSLILWWKNPCMMLKYLKFQEKQCSWGPNSLALWLFKILKITIPPLNVRDWCIGRGRKWTHKYPTNFHQAALFIFLLYIYIFFLLYWTGT